MGVIDTTVVVVIIVVGMLIMYRALKEPLDLLFGFIGRSLGAIKDKLIGAKDAGSDYYGDIRYG